MELPDLPLDLLAAVPVLDQPSRLTRKMAAIESRRNGMSSEVRGSFTDILSSAIPYNNRPRATLPHAANGRPLTGKVGSDSGRPVMAELRSSSAAAIRHGYEDQLR